MHHEGHFQVPKDMIMRRQNQVKLLNSFTKSFLEIVNDVTNSHKNLTCSLFPSFSPWGENVLHCCTVQNNIMCILKQILTPYAVTTFKSPFSLQLHVRYEKCRFHQNALKFTL